MAAYYVTAPKYHAFVADHIAQPNTAEYVVGR